MPKIKGSRIGVVHGPELSIVMNQQCLNCWASLGYTHEQDEEEQVTAYYTECWALGPISPLCEKCYKEALDAAVEESGVVGWIGDAFGGDSDG